MTLDELRAAINTAFAAMQTAHTAITDAPEGTDLAPLEAQFAAAETSHGRLTAQFARQQTVDGVLADQAAAAAAAQSQADAAADAAALVAAQASQFTAGSQPGALPGVVARTTSADVQVLSQPATYPRHNAPHSFFFDAVRAKLDGDPEARERLTRNAREVQEAFAKHANPMMRFAVGSIGTGAAGSAGDFVPPLYLQEDWIAIAQAARPYADAMQHMDLPGNTNVVILPRLATGAAVATQLDNGTVISQDVSTGNVQIPVITIAGQQDISRQLLERSTPGFDVVINQELTMKYHALVDTQALSGSGGTGMMEGVLTNTATNLITYTDATPTGPKLYSKILAAIAKVHTTRFAPATLIVMTPTRWAWLAAQTDTAGRPLVVPVAPYNAQGVFGANVSQGIVGSIASLPVLTDPNLPVNLGGGANQDPIIVTRIEDQWIMEDTTRFPMLKVFEETLSGTMTIRLQLHGYVASTSRRFSAATSVIQGTGTSTPVF